MKKTLIATTLALVSGGAIAGQCAPIAQVTLLEDDRAYVRVQFSSASSTGRPITGVEIGGELVRSGCSGARPCCEKLTDLEVVCDIPENAFGTVRFLANAFNGNDPITEAVCLRGTYVDIE